MGGRHSTHEDDVWLLAHWGLKDRNFISRHLGRTRHAVDMRMLVLVGTRSIRRGHLTLTGVAERAGFSRAQVKVAMKELKVRPRHVGGKPDAPNLLFSSEQADRIATHLLGTVEARRRRWAPRAGWDSCRRCKTTKYKHMGGDFAAPATTGRGKSMSADKEKCDCGCWDEDWKAGDVVMLKSGGPRMTVDHLNTHGQVSCIWFGERSETIYERDFNPQILKKPAELGRFGE